MVTAPTLWRRKLFWLQEGCFLSRPEGGACIGCDLQVGWRAGTTEGRENGIRIRIHETLCCFEAPSPGLLIVSSQNPYLKSRTLI